jgi:hypothetical protein
MDDDAEGRWWGGADGERAWWSGASRGDGAVVSHARRRGCNVRGGGAAASGPERWGADSQGKGEDRVGRTPWSGLPNNSKIWPGAKKSARGCFPEKTPEIGFPMGP